jgi:hypothetical protein
MRAIALAIMLAGSSISYAVRRREMPANVFGAYAAFVFIFFCCLILGW